MAAAAPAAAEQDWEASKENFQPLKTGRKASALRDTTAELRSQAIEERRRAFWEELAAYTGSDPLEVWLRFIKWTQEMFSAGGHKAELLPLLERCTRELQATGQYAGDIRYLRVWIQYADCLPDPGDVFAFLKENEIGQEHALYYVAYATYLEARGNYARADSVYQQGINRLAAPVERLRAKFQEFQQRMARRIQRKAQEQLETSEPEHPERKSLGVLGGRKPARPGGGLLGGAAGLKRKAADQENAPAGSGLDIFVDDEFSAGGGPAASAPAALFQPGRSAAAPWTKLGGFEQNRKENVQRASMWAGQKIKQQAAHSAPAAPALEIFVDPELQELEEHQAAAAAAAEASKPTLRQRLDKGGQPLPEEEIMQNPLQLHKAHAGTVAPLPGLPGRPAGQEAKRRREEAMAFDEAALLGSRGEELCFEEVRAARWLQQQAEQQAAAAQAAAVAAEEEDDLPDMDLEGDTCALGQLLPATAATDACHAEAAPGQALPLHQEQQQPSPVVSPPAPHQQHQTDPVAAFGSPVAFEAPEPAHTAAAAEQAAASPAPVAVEPTAPSEPEVPSMLDDSGAAADEPAQPPCQEQLELKPTPFEQPAEAPYEPTVTLSTRDAFAAINQMFGGALPATELGDSSGAGTSSLPAGLEPTMTIATKDAFAALNKMFKGSLPLEHASLPPNPYSEPTLSFGRGAGGTSGSGGFEPTMTISTKAAFDAINQMFKGALPHEHGTLPPTARGPASYEPTVTISTKAAFDAINQMFGGGGSMPAIAGSAGVGSSKQQDDGFRVPAPRPPRARPAAAAAVTVAPPESPDGGGFCIREDTQFVSVPLGPVDENDPDSPPAAAAAAGGIFGGFCIREDTQFVTVPAALGGAEAADSPALSGGAGGGFCIREDTQFITVAVQQDSEDEDEQQLAAQQQLQLGGDGQQLAAVPAHHASPRADLDGGFSIREDTQFVSLAPAAAAAPALANCGGFHIREDTQFVALGGSSAPYDTSPDASECGGGSGGSLLPRKRPLLERDGSTGDLLDGSRDASPSPLVQDGSPAHSQAGNAAQVSKWGFAPGADDTLALNLDMGDTQALLDMSLTAAAAAAAADTSPADGPVGAADHASGGLGGSNSGALSGMDLQAHMEGLHLSNCKENIIGAAAVEGQLLGAGSSGRRDLADPAVAALALQPLGDGRASQLGVEIEADELAEAQLAAAGVELAEQDSFMVYADDEAADVDSGTASLSSPQPAPAPCGDSSVAGAAASDADQQQQEAGFVTPVQQRPAAAAEALDPFSPCFRSRMLSYLEPGVSEWPGVHCLSAQEEEEAEAGFKAAGRSSMGLVELQLCGLEFAVSGCIGQGAYAKVYQGVDGDCADVALKLEAPPCPWEWYICKALAGRLPDEEATRRCFINPSALLLGARSSVLVAPLGAHGSLQDLVNAYLARQQTPPESIAMHFAAELLRILQHLHAARILHTDIKPDNLLVTLDLQAAGDENAGPALGLQLIDYGRSVDLELLPPGSLLQGDSGTDAFRCVEMREGSTWLWQADAYGVAATIYTLLYGQYMEVERVKDNATGDVALRLRQPFKRQWPADLWGAFYTRLLNHTDATAPPAVGDLIAAFEAHLYSSREAARRLRQELSTAASLLPRNC